MPILSTVEETSAILRKKPASILSDLSRAPHSLPPHVKIPGCRRILFVDVEAWILSHVVGGSTGGAKNIQAPPGGKKEGVQPNLSKLRAEMGGDDGRCY